MKRLVILLGWFAALSGSTIRAGFAPGVRPCLSDGLSAEAEGQTASPWSASYGTEDVMNAALSDVHLSALGDRLLLRITGVPRTTYQVQWSTNLAAWTPQSVVTLPISGLLGISVPAPTDGVPRFWRAVVPDAAPAPRLEIARGPSPNLLTLTIVGTPGVVYRIETTTDGVNWFPSFFGRTIPPGSDRVSANFPVDRGARFGAYRVVAPNAQ